jgi:hypothetical protein
MSKYTALVTILCIAITIVYYFSHKEVFQQKNQVAIVSQNPVDQNVLGEQTKTADCHVDGPFPDPDCSPGAVLPDATVNKICKSGYSSSVRNVSQATKNQVYAEYGIYSHKAYEYEIDHIVSLELGGSNDIRNLFPEAAEPKPGYHEKDLVENYLHQEVCSGRLSLAKAQELIAKNWLQVYQIISK